MSGILRSLPNKIATDFFGTTRLIVLENTLAGPLKMLPAKAGLVIHHMEERDLERFREPGSFITERRIADFAARLKSGRRAFIALSAEQVSGYGWLSRQAEIDARCGVEISLAQDEGCFSIFANGFWENYFGLLKERCREAILACGKSSPLWYHMLMFEVWGRIFLGQESRDEVRAKTFQHSARAAFSAASAQG